MNDEKWMMMVAADGGEGIPARRVYQLQHNWFSLSNEGVCNYKMQIEDLPQSFFIQHANDFEK